MKKWMYVIFPGAMLALFLVVFTAHKKEAHEREQLRAKALQEKIALEKQQKKEAEERAAIDAQKRAQEREEEERKKEEERRAKQAAIDKEIRDGTAQHRAEGDKWAKEVNQLQVELDRLLKQKDDLGRRTYEIAKEVEQARTDKRNAELEQQRFTAMIAQKAERSALTAMPPPPKKQD